MSVEHLAFLDKAGVSKWIFDSTRGYDLRLPRFLSSAPLLSNCEGENLTVVARCFPFLFVLRFQQCSEPQVDFCISETWEPRRLPSPQQHEAVVTLGGVSKPDSPNPLRSRVCLAEPLVEEILNVFVGMHFGFWLDAVAEDFAAHQLKYINDEASFHNILRDEAIADDAGTYTVDPLNLGGRTLDYPRCSMPVPPPRCTPRFAADRATQKPARRRQRSA